MHVTLNRFGIVLAIKTTEYIFKDQELFAHYGYKSKEFPADFEWYWNTLMEIEREERLELELKEKEQKKETGSKLTKKKKKTKGTKKTKKNSGDNQQSEKDGSEGPK